MEEHWTIKSSYETPIFLLLLSKLFSLTILLIFNPLLTLVKKAGCCLKFGLFPMLIGVLSGVTGGVSKSDNNFALAVVLPHTLWLLTGPLLTSESGTLLNTLENNRKWKCKLIIKIELSSSWSLVIFNWDWWGFETKFDWFLLMEYGLHYLIRSW